MRAVKYRACEEMRTEISVTFNVLVGYYMLRDLAAP